ncbi:MAG: hypothetical protein IPF41_13010 [Flavobacteriales bacterium]|nr:hypothetical protein [Flavobacteriales bacterium]
MTTNDIAIVEPPSMRALHLVPFQIDPHYTEATITIMARAAMEGSRNSRCIPDAVVGC